MGRLVLMWVLLSVVLCGAVSAAETAAPSASPQAPPPPSSPAPFPLEWVRLIPTETLNALWDKESKITNRLVPKPEWWSSLEPLQSQVVIREEPDENAKSLGAIRLVLTAPKLSPEFLPPDAAQPIPFTPDLFWDGNIGKHDPHNGMPPGHPWCHQTVMRREGDWVQLPPRPWPKAGWVNIKTAGLLVRPLGSDSYLGSGVRAAFEMDGKPLEVLGWMKTGLCVRPADRDSSYTWDWQDFPLPEFFDGNPSVPVSIIPWKALVDSEGRLKMKLATKPAATKDVKEAMHPQIGWIGLFNPKWDQYLNSEPSLKSYAEHRCAEVKDILARQKCVEEIMAKPDFEFKYEVPVHESPDSASPRIGTIIMRLTDNVYADFRKEGSDESVEFKPDELDPDYGYGVHFHHTYLDKRGSWYKLPANPLPKPGWIDMATVTDTPDDLGLPYGMYDGMGKLVVIRGIAPDGSGVCVRDDRPWDWCGGDVPEDQVTLDEVRVIPWKDLLDKDGHLLLHYANKRGC